MQQCKAYDVFVVLLIPCKALFLCCFKQPRFLFSCYLQNPHIVNSFLLLGPATLTSAFFLLFFNALWDSCSVVFRGNTEKPFGSYLSPHRIQKCCPQFHATCNPPFSALGPVSMEVPSSLSNIIFSLNLICIFLFFPEWAANDVLYYTAQKNLKCQNVFMTTFTYQKHTKLVYTEQDAR